MARLRAALAGGNDPLGRLRPARRCRAGCSSRRSASFCPTRCRAPRQACRPRPAAGAKAVRSRHDRGDHREARGLDPGDPAARRHAQEPDGSGPGLQAHLSTRRSSCWSSSRRSWACRRAGCTKPRTRRRRSARARAQTEAEWRRDRSDDLAKAEQKAAGLSQDLIKAEQRTRLQRLTAPVDGIVQQLAVHTIGGVVTPAQALLVDRAERQPAEIEAQVSNRDIGFVHAGQEGGDQGRHLQFHPLRPAARRGAERLPGRDRSRPSAGSYRRQGTGRGQRQQRAPWPGAGLQRPHFPPQSQMQIDDRLVGLSPGMAVTVEVRTGSRRILSYLMSPLLRYRQETLRER